MVAVTSKAPRLKVGSMPKILKEGDDVENLTRSSNLQSNANIIMGKGAPVTIRTNESGDSPSLHIIINENKGSIAGVNFLQISLTCCLPRGMAAAECAVVTLLATKISVRLAVLLEEVSFNFFNTLGMVWI